MAVNKKFLVRWKQTGETFEATPAAGTFVFGRQGDENAWRSLPAKEFWRVFEKLSESGSDNIMDTLTPPVQRLSN